MFVRTAAQTRYTALSRLAFLLITLVASLAVIPTLARAAQDEGAKQPSGTQSSGAPGSTTQATATQSSTSPAAAQKPATPEPAQEMSTRDSATPFSVRVNLVPIRVVVRDAHGHVLTNLRQEDFQVFEDHKPQVISHFSVETPRLPAASSTAAAPAPSHPPDSEKAPAPLVLPSRYVALLFDDVHLPFGELARIRNIADNFVATSFQPSDRFAVFTISGQSQTDFTDDLVKLHEALRNIQPQPVTAGSASGVGECPSIDYYQADLIVNQHDLHAIGVATNDALVCAFNSDTRFLGSAAGLGQSTALRILAAGDIQTQYSFQRLREIVKRMTVVSGQRLIVLLSGGFLTPKQEWQMSEVIDSAARSNVIISTLDARGLFTVDASPDISEKPQGDPTLAGFHTSYRLQGALRQGDVLFSLADGTGGQRFANSNDLEGGFRRVVSAPETSYLLGFVPQNLKYDGRFHSLQVKVTPTEPKEKYTIQTRAGFYAPKKEETPADAVKQEIEEALLSQEEQHGLPVELHTQYYKVDATDAKLSVLTHVDIGRIQFDKLEGRNRNDLTIVAALFDRNGNFVTATEKVLEMRLRDATLERLSQTGVTVRTNFDVKPGAYIVRLVVRDSRAAQLSAENGVVEIPY
jgi:VWFA-related protein